MTAHALVRLAEANDQAADYLADIHPEWAEALTVAAHIAGAAAIAELDDGDQVLPTDHLLQYPDSNRSR